MRYCYTFENICHEEEGLCLEDGTTKIFLNALGTKGDVSPELKAFLGYVAGNKSDDVFVKELDAEVAKVRVSKEWRREYMTLLMRDRENVEKGEKLLAKLMEYLLSDGRINDAKLAAIDENVRNQLYEEYGLKE